MYAGILFAVLSALGVADVVYVETQALGQVVEPTELEFFAAHSQVALFPVGGLYIVCRDTSFLDHGVRQETLNQLQTSPSEEMPWSRSR